MRGLIGTTIALALLLPAPSAFAQLAARPAEEWVSMLESETRVKGLKIAETVAALGLKPGDVVADVGAGAGVFVPALSAAAGAGGKVYAADIDQGLVDAIAKKAAQLQLRNVVPVLGQFTDPALPARDVDLAFIYDVLHHIEDRPGYILALSKYMAPGGRIALVDFLPDVGGHKGQPQLQVSKAQANAWMAAAGFTPVQDIALFDDKYFVIYERR